MRIENLALETKERGKQTVLQLENVSISKGQQLLKNVSFNIRGGDHTALVGPNGIGKTTLLRTIIGEESPDSGRVIIPNGTTLAYVPQATENVVLHLGNLTILDYFLRARGLGTIRQRMADLEAAFTKESNPPPAKLDHYGRLQQEFELKGGWTIEPEAEMVMRGVGLPARITPNIHLASLSGGEKTKILLAQAVLSKADLLLLDEPSNHLDSSAIIWLGKFLKTYKGAILVVSHKPSFLDQFIQKVIEISASSHTTAEYSGNYSAYRDQKKILEETERRSKEKTAREMAKLRRIISKLKAGSRASMAKDREKKLARLMKKDSTEAHYNKEIRVRFESGQLSGKEVLSIEGVRKKFGNGCLDYSKLNLTLQRGEKIGIVGPVGAGKSTLLKMVVGIISPDSGIVKLGTNVDLGYYAQELEGLDPARTVLQEAQSVAASMPEGRVRSFLGSFLFSQREVFKPVSVLSHGERSRLALAKIALQPHNFLVLDEPTNHLDIPSRKLVATALREFPGSLLLVSHDEALLQEVGLKKIIILPEGKIEWL